MVLTASGPDSNSTPKRKNEGAAEASTGASATKKPKDKLTPARSQQAENKNSSSRPSSKPKVARSGSAPPSRRSDAAASLTRLADSSPRVRVSDEYAKDRTADKQKRTRRESPTASPGPANKSPLAKTRSPQGAAPLRKIKKKQASPLTKAAVEASNPPRAPRKVTSDESSSSEEEDAVFDAEEINAQTDAAASGASGATEAPDKPKGTTSKSNKSKPVSGDLQASPPPYASTRCMRPLSPSPANHLESQHSTLPTPTTQTWGHPDLGHVFQRSAQGQSINDDTVGTSLKVRPLGVTYPLVQKTIVCSTLVTASLSLGLYQSHTKIDRASHGPTKTKHLVSAPLSST